MAAAVTRPLGGVLTPTTERWIRLGSVGTAAIIAACAMVLSYSGLYDLALDAQVSPRLALLVPIMVDGLQFVGSLGVVYSTLSGLRTWYPWMLMLFGVSISVWGNWQASPDALTAQLLHSSSPVILALVLEELLRVMRHKVHLHTEAEAAEQAATATEAAREVFTPTPTPAPETVTPAPAPTPEPVLAQREESVSLARETLPVAVESLPRRESPEPVVHLSGGMVDVTPDPYRRPERASAPEVARPAPAAVRPAPAAPSVRPAAPHPQPAPPVSVPAAVTASEGPFPAYTDGLTLREQVIEILTADPEITAARIARELGKDPSHCRKVVRDVRKELDEATPPAAAVTVPAPVEAADVTPEAAPASRASAPEAQPEVAAAPALRFPEPAIEPAVEVESSLPSMSPVALPVFAEDDDFGDADPFASPAYLPARTGS